MDPQLQCNSEIKEGRTTYRCVELLGPPHQHRAVTQKDLWKPPTSWRGGGETQVWVEMRWYDPS